MQQRAPATPGDGTQQDDKLVILCLHGFRQNASQLRGRLRGLQRRLASVATLVFLDAPHVLPLWRKQQPEEGERAITGSDGPSADTQQQQQQRQQEGDLLPSRAPAPRRAWLLSRELLEEQPQLQAMFARLSCQQAGGGCEPAAAAAWEAAPADVAHDEQYSTQAHGWEASWQLLQQALGTHPRVDGLLGFSQGAAVAAAVAALLQQQQQDGSSLPRLKFVVLASGFVSPAPEHRRLLQELGPLTLPSLHIYASAAAGSDRQIQQQESERLLQSWTPDRRRSIVHSGGHLIPCDRATADQIKAFLLAHSGDGQVTVSYASTVKTCFSHAAER